MTESELCEYVGERPPFVLMSPRALESRGWYSRERTEKKTG